MKLFFCLSFSFFGEGMKFYFWKMYEWMSWD